MLLKWLQIELSRNYFSAPHQSRWAVACVDSGHVLRGYVVSEDLIVQYLLWNFWGAKKRGRGTHYQLFLVHFHLYFPYLRGSACKEGAYLRFSRASPGMHRVCLLEVVRSQIQTAKTKYLCVHFLCTHHWKQTICKLRYICWLASSGRPISRNFTIWLNSSFLNWKHFYF